ncbi:MAG: potassium channel family protein [Gammaproteobacteria bacterium]|nr:potassium channel family protein [Gammaproteobacteria bacterium]
MLLKIFIINSVLITIVVLIHFEALNFLSIMLPKFPVTKRYRVLFGVFGGLIAHALEMWLFAIGYFLLIENGEFGSLDGAFNGTLLDCAYFSFTTYTSLGYGDIAPLGYLRYLAGLEALTGLVMITWTASFMFIEMQKFWSRS